MQPKSDIIAERLVSAQTARGLDRRIKLTFCGKLYSLGGVLGY